MSDDTAPYSSAIEEAAKATGKALDLIKDAGQPIADVYGLMIGDQIHAARQRRLDRIVRKTKEILRERDLAETAELPEQIAIPLLEAAQGEPRQEMQDIWARLLANAMDPSRRDDVRPEFIKALKEFHPADALVLKTMSEQPTQWILDRTWSTVVGLRYESVVVSLSNLVSNKCAYSSNDDYKISPFGIELLIACRP